MDTVPKTPATPPGKKVSSMRRKTPNNVRMAMLAIIAEC
jgi:hypothetical protein